MLATLPLTFMLGSIGVFDMVFTAFLFGAIAFALVAALRNRPRLAIRLVRAVEPCGDDEGAGRARCLRACFFSPASRAAERSEPRCSRCGG